MTTDRTYSSDVAFTPTVKAIQARKGSRGAYGKMEEKGGWQTAITPDLKTFIEAQISIFLATANAEGQPYIQHRGGPPGFLRVLDEKTIGFADFRGNRQYITQGNLADNAKAHLFLVDYTHKRRVKIWGTARIVEGDADPQTFIPYLLDLHRQGKFPFDKLITTMPLAQINEAVEAQHRGEVLKAVLTP